MEYIKARIEVEKSKDPGKVKKIRIAEKNLEKAEDEADKTIDPKLKKRVDELFERLWALKKLVCKENGFIPINPHMVHYPKNKGSKRET